jgi:hypothetical protein
MNVDGAGQEAVRARTAVVSGSADRCNARRRRVSANRAGALNERVECDCRVPVAMRQSHWRRPAVLVSFQSSTPERPRPRFRDAEEQASVSVAAFRSELY